jgi:hypothetical protein
VSLCGSTCGKYGGTGSAAQTESLFRNRITRDHVRGSQMPSSNFARASYLPQAHQTAVREFVECVQHPSIGMLQDIPGTNMRQHYNGSIFGGLQEIRVLQNATRRGKECFSGDDAVSKRSRTWRCPVKSRTEIEAGDSSSDALLHFPSVQTKSIRIFLERSLLQLISSLASVSRLPLR